MELTKKELELLAKAVSFLSANKSEAEEAFDENIDSEELKNLETRIFEEK